MVFDDYRLDDRVAAKAKRMKAEFDEQAETEGDPKAHPPMSDAERIEKLEQQLQLLLENQAELLKKLSK